jgi:VanZ family protein
MNFQRLFWLYAPTDSKAWICVPLTYTLLIQFLTGIPKPDILRKADINNFLIQISEELFDYPFWLQDLSHLPLFFIFAWLWSWFLRRNQQSTTTLLYSAIITTSYAILNELTQFYIPQRFPSVADIIMNISGVLIALTLHSIMIKNRNTTKLSFSE